MAYAVIRTDRMTGTVDGARIISCRYLDADGNPADIENGSIVKIGALIDAEREIYAVTAPSSSDKLSDLAVIASVELDYDERNKTLDTFINKGSDTAAQRAYLFVNRNGYSVTIDAFANGDADSIEVGNIVEVTDGDVKASVVSESTGATQIGTIDEIEVSGMYTYYFIRVASVQ